MMPHQKGGILIMVYNFIKSVVGYWCSGVQRPAGVSRGDGVDVCLTKGREQEVRGRPGDDDRANGVFEVLKIAERWRNMTVSFLKLPGHHLPHNRQDFFLYFLYINFARVSCADKRTSFPPLFSL